jgi:hypothetical protein
VTSFARSSGVPGAIGSREDGVHFVARQVADEPAICTLDGNREDASSESKTLGLAHRDEPEERPHRGEPRIAAAHGVAASCFEVVQER